MTARDWIDEFEHQARTANDPHRLRLVQLVYEADRYRETDPDQMLAFIAEGRTLARQLSEPWWELFYDDRRAGALMKYKGEAATGLELAVRNALEVRKPIYAQFPWRYRIHDHLVVGYLNTDPAGYATEIREALDWMADTMPLVGSPRYLLLARRRWLASEVGDCREAERLARQALDMAASDPDQLTAQSHATFCYSHLCEIVAAREEWDTLGDLAREGERLAFQMGHQLELAEFHMWQALLARREGNSEQAARWFRQATRRVAQLGMPPDHIYFDAWCAFHEQGGEPAEALAVREHELRLLVGRGRWAAEARCRTQRLWLQVQLGQPVEADLEAARAVVRRLRCPDEPLTRLAAVEAAARLGLGPGER
ncbi:MAG: hypothetical protein U0840_03825 [Gemmataceae bacterium]